MLMALYLSIQTPFLIGQKRVTCHRPKQSTCNLPSPLTPTQGRSQRCQPLEMKNRETVWERRRRGHLGGSGGMPLPPPPPPGIFLTLTSEIAISCIPETNCFLIWGKFWLKSWRAFHPESYSICWPFTN